MITRVQIAKNIHGDCCMQCKVKDNSIIARGYYEAEEVYVDWATRIVYHQKGGEMIGHLTTLKITPAYGNELGPQKVQLVANERLEPICRKCLNSEKIQGRRSVKKLS